MVKLTSLIWLLARKGRNGNNSLFLSRSCQISEIPFSLSISLSLLFTLKLFRSLSLSISLSLTLTRTRTHTHTQTRTHTDFLSLFFKNELSLSICCLFIWYFNYLYRSCRLFRSFLKTCCVVCDRLLCTKFTLHCYDQTFHKRPTSFYPISKFGQVKSFSHWIIVYFGNGELIA